MSTFEAGVDREWLSSFVAAPPGWWVMNVDGTEAIPIAGWLADVRQSGREEDSTAYGFPLVADGSIIAPFRNTSESTAWDEGRIIYLPDGLPEGVTYPEHPDNWKTAEVTS